VTNDIRYIAISDVHLGAANSILTHLEGATTQVDTKRASPVMALLVDCLHALVAGNTGVTRPTLIAHGDLIDLALSAPELAVAVFGQFVLALLTADRPLVDDEIVLLPGNHDHLVWEYARERWLEDHLPDVMHGELPQGFSTSRRIGPLRLDAEPRFESTLLSALVQRSSHLAEMRMRVLYPDLVLSSLDGEKAVLITHGQYIESASKVMSGFLRMIAPQIPEPADVATMEEENWPWLDFFFSSMTRSGKPGALIAGIYELAQDTHDLDELVDVVARNVTARSGRLVGALERWGIRRGVGSVVDRIATARERGVTTQLLTSDTRAGLSTYLGSLRSRLEKDMPRLPADTSLVIGHTHKPFREWWPDDHWPGGGLRVFNSGGWVVDHAMPQPLMGGAVVLINDELDVALVRMYQQIDEPDDWRITVDTVEPGAGGEAFAAHIRSLIHVEEAPWSSFSATAAAVIRERREHMSEVLQGKLEVLRD
jgi:UDP-2,3-diacylglucosamine pyrophosphatase LpxH